ncbi:enoyl-CoA hydratase/isomerase family protein [Aestuariibacter sp. A3R04]|uniref:enoyl-CoA hydratase/isomerase family protein n=1 Tax=Aestuariibacter sp. A3R04 TaxID=2841571 RepID=UPI001C08C1F9|nr:enoyl-CoA hydratase/isomerase family protein [Aestuariibacter sp. A3R04]MBU3021678.1 enoyl-CoA hydratase/isomerase family protein [Aestuariibacter sp. A3R04]
MAVIELSAQGQVAVLTMCNGENRHNPVFASQMLARLADVQANEEFKALIITSDDEKNWSQGIDVEWLMPAMQQHNFDEIKAFMYDMDEVFKTLLLFPIPVIAAINGHAFGNGAILSCACDFRFMRSDRGFFCFPEVDLSIPFLPGMIAFVRKAIPQYRLNEMKLTGRRVSGAELAADHVVEGAYEGNEALQAKALAFAAGFDKKRAIFAEHKKRMHREIINVIDTQNKPLIDAVKLMV